MATDVNDCDVVVGRTNDSAGFDWAVRWTASHTIEWLNTGGTAVAINSSGQMITAYMNQAGPGQPKYEGASFVTKDRLATAIPPLFGDQHVRVTAINGREGGVLDTAELPVTYSSLPW